MKIDTEKIKSIRMSLMQKKGDIDEEFDSVKKVDYLVRGTSNFIITPDFFGKLDYKEKEQLLIGLLEALYEELLVKINDIDTVGIWIEYDGKIFENAMKIDILNNMEKYGADDVDPVYEFFKMTINKPALATGDGEIGFVV